MLTVKLAFSQKSSLHFAHNLSNVHLWAMFFLRHLANMSCIVPFWASTGSGFVPIWEARIWSHAVRRRLFIVLMTGAHISPIVFSLRNFLSNIHGLFLTVQATSFTPIVHHIYIFYFTCLVHKFTSSGLHGRLAALGSFYPIHWFNFINCKKKFNNVC
jgi:hypothetical protein